MDYEIGDKVCHVDSPAATATVVRFTAFGRVLVRWDATGRESEENEALMQRADGTGMTWTAETLRSGIVLEEASDDHGAMGVPGTWYRVRQGRDIALTTRNRGNALRLFQRRVHLQAGAPAKCGPVQLSLTGCGGVANFYCVASKGHSGNHTP